MWEIHQTDSPEQPIHIGSAGSDAVAVHTTEQKKTLENEKKMKISTRHDRFVWPAAIAKIEEPERRSVAVTCSTDENLFGTNEKLPPTATTMTMATRKRRGSIQIG